MKKFLIGLVTGLLLAALGLLALLGAALYLGQGRPGIRDGSTLVFHLEGPVPEKSPVRLPIPALEAKAPLTVEETWRMLDRAASDPRIRAVAFFPRRVSAGWGKLREIRDDLVKFRQSGKPLVAYLRNPGGAEYYLATAAGKIYLAPEDLLDVKGLRAEAVFLRKTLDKLGIEVEIEHAGKYKDAGDIFTRTSMSPETREVLESVLDALYEDFLETVAAARRQDVETVRKTLDEGPFLARQAMRKGLVDELLYEDEMYERLREQLGQEKIRKVSHRTYWKAVSPTGAGGERVAFLVASGAIVAGSAENGFGEGGLLASRSFIRLLRQVRADDRIKGVILRIDSPGGDAIASDEILREVKLLRAKKPLVISMSDVAASGGYYIAMTGDPIVAYPATFTGSIGVLYGKVNLRGLYDKLGIQKQTITRGRFADIDSDYKPLSPAARQKLRAGIEASYQDFLRVVAEGRRRQTAEIEPLAEGRVWLGAQARQSGLVDELGGLDRALALIREKAGIPAEKKIRLVPYPRKRSLLDYLFRQPDESLLETRIRKALAAVNLSVWARGGILRLMPYWIEIR